jgi:polysaccharide export outer membrane protein
MLACGIETSLAQTAKAPPVVTTSSGGTTTSPQLPVGYVIGPADVLSIVFWKDKELSADVTVRPDGKISLPLLNEVDAAGATPEQLRAKLIELADKFLEEPNATVVVKEIHSRSVFITGNVAKPATYPLNNEMTVLQLIAVAGGILEYADAKHIVVIRTENGRQQYHKFNYKDVVSQKYTVQNISLQPGDTVVVP